MYGADIPIGLCRNYFQGKYDLYVYRNRYFPGMSADFRLQLRSGNI